MKKAPNHGLPGSTSLLISTNSDTVTDQVVTADRTEDGNLEVEATQKSKRLLPRVEFHDELPQWITSSDEAAYGPWTRTIYIATCGRSKFSIIGSLLHELGHHLIEIAVGKPSWHYAYDDAYDWCCDKVGRFFDFLLRRR